MKKIVYKFCDGSRSEVEVSEEIYFLSESIDREVRLSDRRERRRHVSLESLTDSGIEPAYKMETDDMAFDNFTNECLQKSLECLSEEERSLIKNVYFDGLSVGEIARRKGKKANTMYKKLKRILKKLKKFFEKCPKTPSAVAYKCRG